MQKPDSIQTIEKQLGITLEVHSGWPAFLQSGARNTALTDAGGAVLALDLQVAGASTLDLSQLSLPALCWLNASENESLQTLLLPASLPALVHLDASRCALESIDIPRDAFLQQFYGDPPRTVPSLYLQKNRLKRVRFFDKCYGLELLDLSENQLTELDFLIACTRLRYLYLNDNRLERLNFRNVPLVLEILHLKGNQLEYLPDSLELAKSLKTLYLYGNPLSALPKEVVAGGEDDNSRETVFAYWEGVEKSEGKMEALLEAKMVLVGNGEVGKSSIRIRLLDDKAPLPDINDRTPALDIARYPIHKLTPGESGLSDPIDFQLNIWDFGGQGRYREIQQLLCSRRSLYLFVTSTDDKPGKDDYINFEYWLSMVNAFGFDAESEHHCPVIFVKNKMDLVETGVLPKDAEDIEESKLRGQFPNIQKFIKISCAKEGGANPLKPEIRKNLKEISADIFTNKYPRHWMQVKAWLDDLKNQPADSDDDEGINRYYMPYEKYEQTCIAKPYELTSKEARQWLIILDRIGSVIYLDGDEELKKWVILNPNWIKDGFVKALDSEYIKAGVLETNLQKVIWPEKNETERRIILAFMQAYKLCYESLGAFGEQVYIIPALLPEQKPIALDPIFERPSFKVKLEFDPFIPPGTVNKLMVNLHLRKNDGLPDHARSEGGLHHLSISVYNNSMWKNNVVVHAVGTNSYAHVIEDWEEKSVYFHLIGDHSEALYLCLREMVEREASRLKEMRYMARLGFKDYGKNDKFKGKWAPLEFQNNFFSRPITYNDNMKKSRIFVSYAHSDGEDFKNKLGNHLSSLRNQDLIADWTDRKIEAGEWDGQIENAMEEADIFVLLVTPGFLASRYIFDKELKTAYNRYKAGEAKIMPVICDFCEWQLQPVSDTETALHPVTGKTMKIWLGIFQPFPRDGKPIIDKSVWQNENQAFLEFVNALKKEIF